MDARRVVAVAGATLLAALGSSSPAAAVQGSDPELVSQQPGGEPFAYLARDGQVSADGNRVLFFARAGNDGPEQVWVRDRAAGTTTMAYQRSDLPGPAVSGNLRYIAFVRDPLSGSDNRTLRVVDLRTGSGRTVASFAYLARPSFSDDGRTIAFTAGPSGISDQAIYVKNLITGTTKRVTSIRASHAVISGDATKVAYRQYGHVYSKTLSTGKAIRVDVRPDGTLGPRSEHSAPVAYSDNTKFLLFTATASQLVTGTGACADAETPGCAFRRNFVEAKTTVASVLPGGGVTTVGQADLSGDGKVAAFDTDNAMDDRSDVYTRPFATAATRLASANAAGEPSDESAFGASLSTDGSWTVFDSHATNYGYPDVGNVRQVWIASNS